MQPLEHAHHALAAPFERRITWLAYALASAALAFAGWFPLNNPDTFGHLAQGRQIAQLGHVPQLDTFSFWRDTPAPWHNYEWLSDLWMFRGYSLFGYDGLIAGKCLLLALTAALLVRLAQLLSGARGALLCSLLIVAAIPAVRFRLTERPHLVALPLATAYLIAFAYLMRAWGRGSAHVDRWIVVAIGVAQLAWVNLHGSHLLGLLLTLIHLGCAFGLPEARRKLGVVLGLQLFASCVSPFGPAILRDAVAHVLDPAYRALVTEWEPWQPTDPLWLLLAPTLQTLMLALVVRPLARFGAVGKALLIFVCVLALAAFRSIRFVDAYLLVSAPVLAIGACERMPRLTLQKLTFVLAGPFCAAAVLVPWASAQLPPFEKPGGGMSSLGLPAASGQWLAVNTVHPRVLAAIEDSWYLMFAAPQAQFLVDGRIPFYGPEHIARIREALADPRALTQLLDHDRVNVVVPRHTFKPHKRWIDSMAARADWTLVSIEDRYAIYVRNEIDMSSQKHPQPLMLRPSYEPAWLLDADAPGERAILAALRELPEHTNNRGYRGWIRAILALKPMLRTGRGNGIRPPANRAETIGMRQALGWLVQTSRGAEGVPVVHAYTALVAAALCELDIAEAALRSARWEGESRETLLGAEEIALRRGQTQEVDAFLRRAAAMPGAEHDVWLEALSQGLRSVPRCP